MDTSSALTTYVMPTRTATRRTISPYDLIAGDNPGTLIFKPSLREPNYDKWSTNLRLALKARKKFGFADGTIPQPVEGSDDYEDLIANNALVVSWMKLTIDENIAASMTHFDDSHELLTHIQKRLESRMGNEFNDSKQSWLIVTKKELPLKHTLESFLNCGEVWLIIRKPKLWKMLEKSVRKINYISSSWSLMKPCTEE